MRKIQFRGKKKDSGEWVFGNFYTTGGGSYIVKSSCEFYKTKVIPKTVGQYTGLTDKNGVKIFEGDIINCTNYHGAVAGIVDFNHGTYYLACSSGFSDEYLFNCSHIEVIGNIHDNPDLLKGGEKDFLKAKECKKE